MKDPIERQAAIQPEQQRGRVFKRVVVEYPSYNIYPEYIGKPYFSIKYMENGQEFIGYGTYSPEVLSEYLKEYFMPSSAQPEQRWIPVQERLPEDGKEVLVTDDENIMVAYYRNDAEAWDNYNFGWVEGRNEEMPYGINKVIAWMPLPEPYRGVK